MSTININGNITGDHNHIGDLYMHSKEEYLQNSSKEFSQTERELIDIIFQNTDSEEERKELLLNLQKSSEHTPPKKSIWKPFIDKLIDKGGTVLATKIADYIGENLDSPSLQ